MNATMADLQIGFKRELMRNVKVRGRARVRVTLTLILTLTLG